MRDQMMETRLKGRLTTTGLLSALTKDDLRGSVGRNLAGISGQIRG